MKKIYVAVLCLFVTTAMAEGIDKRQVLPMNEMQRNHLLGEMRLLLTGTGAILEALAQEDMVAVAHHARSLGMEMPHKVEGHANHGFPEQFMQLGMAMHQEFDKIALDAESKKDGKRTLQQLSEALGRCAACHATYQISVSQNVQENGHGEHGAHSHAH